MPQLDGLRALAVLAVWFEHWGIQYQPVFRWVEWGRLGVWLFFVLSGFLITDILQKSKDETDARRQTVGYAARAFYIRRFLRILPVYYATVLIGAIFIHDLRRLFPWHVTYTTDFWTALHPGLYPYGIHFWTLSVEEQFYLAWPWLILLIPQRRLASVAGWSIVVGVCYRALFQAGVLGHSKWLALGLPILGNIDKFGFGALLAILSHSRQPKMRNRLCMAGLWIGLPAVVLMEVLFARNPDSRAVAMFSSAAAGLFFTWVIGRAATGFRGPAGAALASPVLVYPGKISYGLYLFHPFIPLLFVAAHIPLPRSIWPQFFALAIGTMIVATASWYGFERPLNGLKRYFPYTPQPGPTRSG